MFAQTSKRHWRQWRTAYEVSYLKLFKCNKKCKLFPDAHKRHWTVQTETKMTELLKWINMKTSVRSTSTSGGMRIRNTVKGFCKKNKSLIFWLAFKYVKCYKCFRQRMSFSCALPAAFPPVDFLMSFSSEELVTESHPTNAQHW